MREALSQVQMLYARESRGEAGEGDAGGEGGAPAAGGAAAEPPAAAASHAADRPPRLWTPPGAS